MARVGNESGVIRTSKLRGASGRVRVRDKIQVRGGEGNQNACSVLAVHTS